MKIDNERKREWGKNHPLLSKVVETVYIEATSLVEILDKESDLLRRKTQKCLSKRGQNWWLLHHTSTWVVAEGMLCWGQVVHRGDHRSRRQHFSAIGTYFDQGAGNTDIGNGDARDLWYDAESPKQPLALLLPWNKTLVTSCPKVFSRDLFLLILPTSSMELSNSLAHEHTNCQKKRNNKGRIIIIPIN